MMVTAMELHSHFGEFSPLFGLDRTRDALAAYCAFRWPVGRRKSVAREWDLSTDEARSVCEGSASQTTLDRVWAHKNGGWEVLAPVFGALLGQTVEQHLIKQRKSHVEHARRLGSLVRNGRSGDPGGAVRSPELGSASTGGRQSVRR